MVGEGTLIALTAQKTKGFFVEQGHRERPCIRLQTVVY